MRKIFLALSLLFITVYSCNNEPKEFTIDGTTIGVDDGTQVFLKQTDSLGKPVTLDTAVVRNGKFKISAIPPELKLAFVFVDKSRGRLPIITEKGENITMTFNNENIGASTFGGSKYNEDLYAMFSESVNYGDSLQKINIKLRELSKTKDTVKIRELVEIKKQTQESQHNSEIKFIQENPDSFVSLILIENNLTVTPDKTDELKIVFKAFDNLSDELKSTNVAKKIKNRIDKVERIQTGKIAPQISGPTPDEKIVSLSDVKGKATLIDFWASWCKPCREENPNLVKLYSNYKNDGFSILGISTDKDGEVWKTAVVKDSINYTQIKSEKAAEIYNINFLPTSFLLNEKGEIVYQNLRGADLEAKVAEILGVENKHIIQ
ncbi:TlpA disulfide reductase family protein [Neptunitalea lumnitzerae]|uniref:Thiol:disulfide interchange protein n=1 Tax=Neptunitalea lumnitzerae TaxID=2965509 RepID=A0ABQ5MJW3_9FLAO|nr:TlpA disulfide reductase family protein [Neptunitalea sp. Y10]GLB49697.1 thiol:disulfide interchange protein [Neptunitalea sp. Y10]